MVKRRMVRRIPRRNLFDFNSEINRDLNLFTGGNSFGFGFGTRRRHGGKISETQDESKKDNFRDEKGRIVKGSKLPKWYKNKKEKYGGYSPQVAIKNVQLQKELAGAKNKTSTFREKLTEGLRKSKQSYKSQLEKENPKESYQIKKGKRVPLEVHYTEPTGAADLLKEVSNKRRFKSYKEKRADYLEAQKRYEESRTGRAAAGLGKVFSTLQTKQGITKRLYQRQGLIAPTRAYRAPPKFSGERQYLPSESGEAVQGKRSGKPGRPYGTYAPEYAQYGGVYNFRKAMSHQRRLERLQAQQAATISPEQQAFLRQQAMAQQVQRVNPEAQTIPSTNGKIDTGSYNAEIDAATHAFE